MCEGEEGSGFLPPYSFSTKIRTQQNVKFLHLWGLDGYARLMESIVETDLPVQFRCHFDCRQCCRSLWQAECLVV